jgi:CheY-like chemotaxis protein
MRVLVVDDCHDTTQSFRLLLGAWGEEVLTANDGESALALAASSLPDVVLLDLLMPGLDGYEVARGLRALPGLGRVVVVAVTRWSGPLEPGDEFDLRLVKPFEPDDLKRLLEVCAAGRQQLVQRGELVRGVARKLRRQAAEAIAQAAALLAHARAAGARGEGRQAGGRGG